MDQLRVGFALCGSFCTLSKALIQMRELKALGADIFPIMSENAIFDRYALRQGGRYCRRNRRYLRRPVIHTIRDAEPIGPKRMIDILIIEPCTGNTLAKLANRNNRYSCNARGKSAYQKRRRGADSRFNQ